MPVRRRPALGRPDRPRAAPDARPASAASTCTDARVGEPAVVALADDRDHDLVGPDRRIGRDRRGDRAVEHAPDRHRRGQVDRRLDQPHSRDLEEARQLARAVQHRRSGRHRRAVDPVARPGQDRRHAGARDTAADGRLRLVADDGDVADAHPATSVIAFARPASRWPIRRPSSRSGTRSTGREPTRRALVGSPPRWRLSIPLVWSDAHRLHEPAAEIWVGVRTPAVESRREPSDPRRADRGRRADGRGDAARRRGARGGTRCRLLEFLASAWGVGGGRLAGRSGPGPVVPYIFPHPGLMGGLEPPCRRPRGRGRALLLRHDDADRPGYLGGRPGRSRCGADGGRPRRGRGADRVRVLPPARPPRHPERLRRLLLPQQRRHRGRSSLRDSGAARVAIVDIDAHHGNGAQSIFWERDDVFTASVHIDPATGWFPHFLGGAAERGGAQGSARTCNIPLPPGTGTTSGCGPSPSSCRRRGRAVPRRSCWRSASTRPAPTRRARSTLRLRFSRGRPPIGQRGCRSSSYRRVGTISPRSAGSCSRRWKDLEEGHGNA